MALANNAPTTWAASDTPHGIGRGAVAFRLRAFGFHLLGSASLLTLVLGGLYLGWYRWPGWYLAGAQQVAILVAIVDAALGPLSTLIIASPVKPRRVLARDIAVIVAVQVAALVYGCATLWHGRPLYYAFSVDRLQMVQAYDLDSAEVALGRSRNPGLAPTWHSLPRWIWAPLPDDPQEQKKIMKAAISGGPDVIQMPRYFKPWDRGVPELRKQLKKVDDVGGFTKAEKQVLRRKMSRLGFAPGEPDTIFLTGRVGTVLAVFDRATMHLEAMLAPD
jgi:hypothetical protein